MPHPRGNTRERGTALIMSLVILMILTILGITAMSTASLEEKMSGNTQEGTRAFEVAESGLQSTLGDFNQFKLSSSVVTPYPINGRVAQVTTSYLQETEVPRGLGFSNDRRAYHFQQVSKVNAQVDSANIGLNTTVTRGVAQIK
jgi:Tfp pilus assembly protein PilX